MDHIRNIDNTIGLDVYMNCVLVRAGLRNAMLIQPADYKETRNTDPITAAKLKAIKRAFPELVQSTINGEIIVSKKVYKTADIKEPADMGRILGFPCAGEYRYVLDHPDEPKTSINIHINLKPGGNVDRVQIIAYVCRGGKTYIDAVRFAEKAEAILKADPAVGEIVENVVATKDDVMPSKYLIQKLLSNSVLSEQEQAETLNYIWNLGLDNANIYNCDFKNPVHRGILIGLLSVYDNNPLEPFYPLQYRPENKKVNEITAKWDTALQGIFAAPTGGGAKRVGRKTRKRAGGVVYLSEL
jgi:hypothetical protein